MKSIGIRKRSRVLKYSLKLENFVSYELAFMLDIKDYKKSKSLGNGSSSLSVNQKLNILLDIGNISKVEKTKIGFLMSIRNQFMHNIDAINFEYVFDKIDGLEKSLRRFYPELFSTGLEKEIVFEQCLDNLFKDSIKMLLDQKGNKLQKLNNKGVSRANEIMVKHYRNAIRNFALRTKEFLLNQTDEEIDKIALNYPLIMIEHEVMNEAIDEILKELLNN